MIDNNSLWQVIKSYFNSLPNKEDEEFTKQQINDSISFRGSTLWILIFAIFIASLGLNVNSTAVIIGAMLISPLMGPITGMGLAVGIGDLDLLRRSFKNYVVMVLISVITATIYFMITPLKDAQSELLARTSPTLYDVMIALFGGAAGIMALATKGKGNVLPGVAIATALMPPLCTAGYGLGTGNLQYFLGAFYLFFINTVFICFATILGVKMFRFKRKKIENITKLKKVNHYITIIVVLTIIPAAFFTIEITRKSFINNSLRNFVKNEFHFKGTQIIQQNINPGDSTIQLLAVGRVIPDSAIKAAEKALTSYDLDKYKLKIIQGSLSDSVLLATQKDLEGSFAASNYKQQFVEQSSQIHALEEQLEKYTYYENISSQISKEIVSLYPSVQSISLTKVTENQTDTIKVKHYVLALIKSKGRISTIDSERLERWLKSRTKADSLRLIVNP